MKRLIIWLSAVGVLVVIFGTIYAVVQQAERQGANFPQVQLAEDTAALLNQGIAPAHVLSGRVNLVTSLAPFILIYDKHGTIVDGMGFLGDGLPAVPSGMLTAANGQAYSAVTWQPKADVRIAAVVVAANDYYVLSGRSLTEVEKNENHTFQLAFLGGWSRSSP